MRNYIYVDNSNLCIEGQRVSAVKRKHALNIFDAMNRGILDFNWNLNYGKLYELVCGEKSEVACARLWGSPPPGDSFWEFVKRKGWEVQIYDRNVAGKEKKVDTAITYCNDQGCIHPNRPRICRDHLGSRRQRLLNRPVFTGDSII